MHAYWLHAYIQLACMHALHAEVAEAADKPKAMAVDPPSIAVYVHPNAPSSTAQHSYAFLLLSLDTQLTTCFSI